MLQGDTRGRLRRFTLLGAILATPCLAETPLFNFGGTLVLSESPTHNSTADVNKDGHADLMVASRYGGTVRVFLGDGAGRFTEASGSPHSVSQATAAVPADFDRDGNLDLAVTQYSAFFSPGTVAGAVTILHGDGTGRFVSLGQLPYMVPLETMGAAAGDFNGDGRVDLAVAGGASVVCLLGDGAGGFGPPSQAFSTNGTAVAPVAADWNADGKLDVASATDANAAFVSVGYGNGDGTFSRVQFSNLGGGITGTMKPLNLAVGDFNGDGQPDLAAVARGSFPGVLVWLTGPGGFDLGAAFVSYATDPYYTPQAIAATDFGPDGKVDWATVTPGKNEVEVRFGDGTGAFAKAPGTPFAVGSTPVSLAPADFNGDGKIDIATANAGDNTLTILLNGATLPGALQPQSISFPAIANRMYSPEPFPIQATASSGLPVVFTSTTPDHCTVSGSVVTMVLAGACSITASQPGDATYDAAVPVTRTFTIEQVAQTRITFDQTYGPKLATDPPFPVSATTESGLPVTIELQTPGACSLAGNIVTPLAAGSCYLIARQPGNANYAASSTGQSITILDAPREQIINFPPIPNHQLGDPPFTVIAMATSGLAVTVVSNSTGVCTISNFVVTLAAAGNCVLVASQAGNSTYLPAPPVTRAFAVGAGKQPQTISFSLPVAKTYGDPPFTLAATASSGLPVAFLAGTPAVCAVSGNTVTILAAGLCSITASQAGNQTYDPAPPVTQPVTILKAPQTISFGSIPTKTFGDAPFPIATQGGASGNPVTLTVTSGPGSLNGDVLTILGAGTLLLAAHQAGNGNYFDASASISIMVLKAPQPITLAYPPQIRLGDPPSTIIATAGSFPVALASNTPAICTLSGSLLTAVAAGTCMITASHTGDANHEASSRTVNIQVTEAGTVLASQSIQFAPLAGKRLSDPPFSLTATATSGLAVAYASETPPVCAVNGDTVMLAAVGTCSITAVQPGNSMFAPAQPVTQSFLVDRGLQTIEFPPPADRRLAGPPFTLQATASSGLPVTFALLSGPAILDGSTLTPTDLGTITVEASQPGNENWEPAAPVTQTIQVVSGPAADGPVIQWIGNAASYGIYAAPESYAVLFGSSLMPSDGSAIAVSIEDAAGAEREASVVSASAQQLNLLLPPGLAGGSAHLRVSRSGVTSAPFTLEIHPTAPGIFTADASGRGAPAAQVIVVSADGVVNTFTAASCEGGPPVCTPAAIALHEGDQAYLILYGTGIRGDGSAQNVAATVGGVPVPVLYAGPQGEFRGLDQVNLLISATFAAQGDSEVRLTVNGDTANPVTIHFE